MLKENILEIIEPVLEIEGVELYDLELRKHGNTLFLCVYIDKENGVTIDDCSTVSRHIEMELDAKDIIPGKYVLEVSSPGLDRPLITNNDFRRALNQKITILLKEKIDNKKKIEGKLISFDENEIIIENEIKKVKQNIHIIRENIDKAKIKIEF